MFCDKTALIVSLPQASVAEMLDAAAQAAGRGADMVEYRLDCLADLDESSLAALLAHKPLPVIATFRPTRQGGRYADDESRRLALLAAAARLGADYVDVEYDVPLDQRPPGRKILSFHDFHSRPDNLPAILNDLCRSEADVVKIAFASRGPEDCLAAWELIRRSSKPAIVIAMGEHGLPSRLLAKKFGAFGTFASLETGRESAPGQVSLERMRSLYRWEQVGPGTDIYGVIGCPLGHSMSPAIHNAALAKEEIDAVYVPLRIEPKAADFQRFFDAVQNSPWAGWAGFSVTIPHKEAAFDLVGAENLDELSRRIGAINTIRMDADGGLAGWNTDYAAIIDALTEAMGIPRNGLMGRTVAVLGAGGVARAAVAALTHYGARVTVYNRTPQRGKRLAEEFSAKALPMTALPEMSAEIILHCTSVGMHPAVDATPMPRELLDRLQRDLRDSGGGRKLVVFESIYNPLQTLLLRHAAQAGCLCISGVEMFVRQAAAQFELWTGRAAPRELVRQVVLRHLAAEKHD